MTAPAVVGIADHYAAFVKLCRARIDELGITYDTVDEICNWPARYCSALMCGSKSMSVHSMFVIAGALALKPLFVHDQAQRELLTARDEWIEIRRKGPRWRRKYKRRKNEFGPDYWKNLSIIGNLSRTKKLTPQRRSQIARKAIKARWSKHNGRNGNSANGNPARKIRSANAGQSAVASGAKTSAGS